MYESLVERRREKYSSADVYKMQVVAIERNKEEDGATTDYDFMTKTLFGLFFCVPVPLVLVLRGGIHTCSHAGKKCLRFAETLLS
jgi:hypothetical protein